MPQQRAGGQTPAGSGSTPLAPRQAPGSPRHSLPTPLTSFVGRAQQLHDLAQLLATHRLVTLTGAPGVGKTRLALRIATDLAAGFADGACFVPLAEVTHPTLVVPAFVHALGLREHPARPRLQSVQDFLQQRTLLVVLDNCEHVLEAAASAVADLLAAAPGLRVLATSRAPLHLYGEHEFPVLPLELPNPARAAPVPTVPASEAVQLFVERARAPGPDPGLAEADVLAVAEICRRLDGLPLAIELAAARSNVLPPRALLHRLKPCLPELVATARDLPARHQTLRAAIGWSYDLLAPEQQRLFRRLAVFVGGFSLEAAETVAGGWESGSFDRLRMSGGPAHGELVEPQAQDERSPAHGELVEPQAQDERGPSTGSGRAGEDLPTADCRLPPVLDGLASLVDQSLVQPQPGLGARPRFKLLETIREFALERLADSGELEEAGRRHAHYFQALSGRAELELWGEGTDMPGWLDRVEGERDNLRAALRWDAEQGEAESGLLLCSSLVRFWIARGPSEGRRQISELLALAPTGGIARAKGLLAVGMLAIVQSDLVGALPLLQESERLMREAGHRRCLAEAVTWLGAAVALTIDPADAALLEQGLATAREMGNGLAMIAALFWLAEVARLRTELARATALLHECLKLALARRDRWGCGYMYVSLGAIAAMQGNWARAEALLREAGGRFQGIGAVSVGVAGCLEGLACAAARQGRPDRAARLFGAEQALLAALGAARYPFWVWEGGREAAEVATRERLGEEAFAAAFADGQAMPLAQAMELALSSPAPPQGSSPRDQKPSLTRREREVAGLVAHGWTNRQIAQALVVSERTVDSHVSNALAKLDLASRAQLAVWAVRHGLVGEAGPEN